MSATFYRLCFVFRLRRGESGRDPGVRKTEMKLDRIRFSVINDERRLLFQQFRQIHHDDHYCGLLW